MAGMDSIVHDLEIGAPVEDLWAAFTEADHLTRWLCQSAAVSLKVGGAYEIRGPLGGDSSSETMGGTILALEEEYSLRVAWSGPALLAPLLNVTPRPTTLFVRFQPLGPARCRLHLEHLGWGDGEEWQAARDWHEDYWREALARLKPVLEA
jgi:uncharacterized protein YndB with AHSA1/START domain